MLYVCPVIDCVQLSQEMWWGQGTIEVDDGGVSNSNLIRLMKELAGYILQILSCCLSHQTFCKKDPSQPSCRGLLFIDRWTDEYQSAGLMWSGGNSRNLVLWVWRFTMGLGRLLHLSKWRWKALRKVLSLALGFDERYQGSSFCCFNFDSWSHQHSLWDFTVVALSASLYTMKNSGTFLRMS